MIHKPHFTIKIEPRETLGWAITTSVYPTAGSIPFHPDVTTQDVIDPTLLVGEVARLTARMALGRETP